MVTKYVHKSKDWIVSEDFLVRKKGDDLYFYLLDRHEEYRIVVLAEKR